MRATTTRAETQRLSLVRSFPSSILAHPYLTLLGISMIARLATASVFAQPGYMDAYYNYVVAQNLLQGKGLTEDFIWNYLWVPQAITHPSNLYWMPLTALVIFLSLAVFGQSFFASQIPFILLSSALVPMAYYAGKDIFRDRRYAWTIALLTLFSPIYFPYWTLPDNVCLFAVTSLAALIFAYKALNGSLLSYAATGVFVALSYLTRADGLLILPAVIAAGILAAWGRTAWGSRNVPGTWRQTLAGFLVMGAAFVAAVSPWLLRNWLVAGTPLPPGASQAIFLREYNDIFSYARTLDLRYYLNIAEASPDWGLWPILTSKLSALGSNLLLIGRPTFFAMAPLFVIGMLYRRAGGHSMPLWQRREYLPFLCYAVILYLSMSLLFTFPSPRGSVMHSSGGILPFVLGATVTGVDAFAKWISGRFRPKAEESRRVTYSAMLLLASVLLSVGFTVRMSSTWDEHFDKYQAIGRWFEDRGLASQTVMIVDPPGYYYAAGQRSIVLSNDSIETDVDLARRYGAEYIVLEEARPEALTTLYIKRSHPNLRLLVQIQDAQIYEIRY